VCEIVLFRAIIVLFVAVGVVLIVGTCCTIVVSAAPIYISHGVGVWAPNGMELESPHWAESEFINAFF
jgi:hypothetical protein